ncbi:MAG: NotI family restriction endonuclease [Candidatus Competibacteraceae bacterium]
MPPNTPQLAAGSFINKVPSCTKDKAKNPLGVCSIFHNDSLVITCPIRFREDWLIVKDAANFFGSSRVSVEAGQGRGSFAGIINFVTI